MKSFTLTRHAVVKGTILTTGSLSHIIENHSVMSVELKSIMSNRQRSCFLRIQPFTGDGGNSAFICVTLVEPLIKATLFSPDKIIREKSGKLILEKAFKTEIGHNVHGCCHIVHVVTVATSGVHTTAAEAAATHTLLTAYPVKHFTLSME